ncbi:hypothetical protein ACNJX9_17790 [Bradyrhizobium sp. DASA03076]|uniref:hypothetical protein n=1 Tax=Bradyrhizobium sp. BLXBL-03 TaxID=3395916 RepID=UPI003F6F2205
MNARPTTIITASIPRIVPDEPGGWFVIKDRFGWLYGSRREAVQAARDLVQEARP